jgi:hypothetical protein
MIRIGGRPRSTDDNRRGHPGFEDEMSLRFIGDIGVYFPDRDAIKITALSGDEPVDCYAMRSALSEIGCLPDGPLRELIDQFERQRRVIELAAMVKYRRTPMWSSTIAIGKEDVLPLAWL